MKFSSFSIIFILGIMACSAQEIPEINVQIEQALLALPEELRDEATVLGYKDDLKLSVIRKGSNSMICLADDPQKDGFSVAGIPQRS